MHTGGVLVQKDAASRALALDSELRHAGSRFRNVRFSGQDKGAAAGILALQAADPRNYTACLERKREVCTWF